VGLPDLAGRIDEAADRLSDAAAAFAGLDPGARALAADSPGRLGELGRALHLRLASGLAARSDEAAAHRVRLADTADALRVVAAGYADVDTDARGRHDDGAL
jgi:hypothetical protein